jgi:hypothetical protein
MQSNVLINLAAAQCRSEYMSFLSRSLPYETFAGNAIASLVHRLRLDRNIIVLKLTNLYAEDSEDEDQQEEEAGIPSSTGRTNISKSHSVEVEVDLGMTAYANVSRLYGHKKVAQAKEIKTVQVWRVTFRLALLLASLIFPLANY